MIEELQQHEDISNKRVEPSNFEELMSNKYRITIEDLGGSKRKYLFQHWIDELSKPLQVTQQEIREHLNRFVKSFPVNSIPHQTEDEKNIDEFKRKITKTKVKILQMSRD